MQNSWVLRGKFLLKLGRIPDVCRTQFLCSVSSLFDNGVFNPAELIQMLMTLTPVDCQRFISDSQFHIILTILNENSCPKRRSTSLWKPYFQRFGLFWPKNTQMSCYKLNLIIIILSAMNILCVFSASFSLLLDK